jgi:ubiquinone/menaquinone biosynthesis C-methylase UbiE
MRAATELGFSVFGIDISFTGLRHARERLLQTGLPFGLALASMHQLPFADDSFDAILSYGAFCYGLAQDMRQAIVESFRVLRRPGRLFVVLRSTDDYRYGKGRALEGRTFELNIAETNELGTIQHFLREQDITDYFSRFSQIRFEKSESTFGGRTRLNSDWVITAEK